MLNVESICFKDIIRNDLYALMDQWNCHQLRKQQHSELPAEKPETTDIWYEILRAFSCKNRCRNLFR